MVFQVQLHQRRKTQTEARGVGAGKNGSQELIQEKTGFEIRPGRAVFDGANALAQVELLAVLGRWAEQPLQAPAQVRSFADVGLGMDVVPAKQEHGGPGRNCREYLGVLRGHELEPGRKHEAILVWIRHRAGNDFLHRRWQCGIFDGSRGR